MDDITGILAWGSNVDNLWDLERPHSLIVSAIALSALAMFIISCVSLGGAMSSQVAGWTVLSLSATGLVLRCALGRLKERKIYMIPTFLIAATFMLLGTLGGAGLITATQLGWGVVGTSLISAFIKIILLFKCENEIYVLNPSRDSHPINREPWSLL